MTGSRSEVADASEAPPAAPLMDIDVRPIVQDEFPTFLRTTSRAFGGHALEEDIARYAAAFVPGRWVGAFDGPHLVGGASSVPGTIGVEGGALPVAAVEDVTVQPTHTRRGIMTRMIGHQLRDVHDRGEPIAALWASESIIYGRFGYGVGSFHEQWKIPRSHTAFLSHAAGPGDVEFVTPGDAGTLFPSVFRRAMQDRPAAIDRPQIKWEVVLADPERDREGASAFFHIAYLDGGEPEGYASYRTRRGVLSIWETMSVTDAAHAALWQYLFGVDLINAIEAYNRPVDDPLPWMLADPRRLERRPTQALWVRLVDAASALEGRRYMRPGRLVLEVEDRLCPWNQGRYELEAGLDGATVKRSRSAADLAMSVADLAACYMGSVRPSALAQVGRVEERTPGSAARADAMFATRLAPWCPYAF